MKNDLLFDTNIIIDYLNGKHYAKKWVDFCTRRSLSVVSVIEILCGIPVEKESLVHHWLYHHFTVLSLDDAVILEAVHIRRKKMLKLPDTLILATTVIHRLTLCTRDTKDFSTYPDAKIIVPKCPE